ncbi:hypothetical protein CBM2634_A10133 [Cupriavidus taiwanensis]|uniref:Uncharacterized protein n=1 Tax=Cupriavidus taiwanensis TaxID=164546 RepID=A0A375IWL3_9BURK|nr:hypothetical protein CBM2634_A10133 [Cupriavidus taiwanensis]
MTTVTWVPYAIIAAFAVGAAGCFELEEDLGGAVFDRIRQCLVLTPAGAEYARRIPVSLDQIRRDTLELVRLCSRRPE